MKKIIVSLLSTSLIAVNILPVVRADSDEEIIEIEETHQLEERLIMNDHYENLEQIDLQVLAQDLEPDEYLRVIEGRLSEIELTEDEQFQTDNNEIHNSNFKYDPHSADITPPVIHVDTLEVSQKEATVGDEVKVSIEVTDDKDIR